MLDERTLALPNMWEGQRPFEYGLDVLAENGVRFTPEQIDLLDRALNGYGQISCMTTAVVWEPMERYHQKPMVTYDVDADEVAIVVYPEIVVVDETYMDHLEEANYSPVDWRFPSVPGRQRVISRWWDPDLQAPEAIRLWNLQPIPAEHVDDLEHSVGMWLEEDIGRMQEIAFVDQGEVEICDWASGMGLGDVENHEHTDWEGNPLPAGEEDYITSGRCKTGETGLAEMYDDLTVAHPTERTRYNEPVHYWKPLTEIRLPPPLRDTWARLRSSSEANAHRAMRLFPPWDRDHVAITERHYSPWLWSS